MKFQVGDKVKFLNEEGGGIVSEILTSSMVKVATEDGFDLPTMNHELVLVNPKTHSEGMFNQDFKVETDKSERVEQTPYVPVKNIKYAKEASGVYLAFVPHDQRWMITGMVDVYLINHTSFDVLYSLLLKDEQKYIGYDFSSIKPHTPVLLESVERDQMDYWNEGIVQILYQSDEMQQVILPAHASFKVKSARLNNENSYQTSGLVDGRAIVISLNEIHQQQKLEAIEMGKEAPVEVVKAKVKKKEALIDKHTVLPKIAEVDLHIAELIDNISGMESRDMFALQKRYFKDCLDSAIANNFKKVTFIHGVGNGILKNAIVEILQEYESIDNQTASISKYGVGAIDVLIKPWE